MFESTKISEIATDVPEMGHEVSEMMHAASEMVHNLADHQSKDAMIESLVEQAMIGDSEALHSLCETLGDSVIFRVKYILGSKMNKMDAEDVSQEVFIRMCRNIRDLKNPKAFAGWLSSIIANEASRYAKNVSENGVLYSLDEHLEEVSENKIDFIPDEYVENNEFRKKLMDIILNLPTPQRRAIIFYYYAELTLSEIATIMNITHQGVSRNLARARENIKIALIKQPVSADLARNLFCELMVAGVEPLRFYRK